MEQSLTHGVHRVLSALAKQIQSMTWERVMILFAILVLGAVIVGVAWVLR